MMSTPTFKIDLSSGDTKLIFGETDVRRMLHQHKYSLYGMLSYEFFHTYVHGAVPDTIRIPPATRSPQQIAAGLAPHTLSAIGDMLRTRIRSKAGWNQHELFRLLDSLLNEVLAEQADKDLGELTRHNQ